MSHHPTESVGSSPLQTLPIGEAHKASSGYFFPFLDGLRGIAILSVVIAHTAYVNPSDPISAFLLCLIYSGVLGVPIFFTLSGFLISLAVFTSPQPFDFYAYACRRVAKIIPPFFLALVLVGLWEWYQSGSYEWVWMIIRELSTLPNFLGGRLLIGPDWSLFVEIHFYMLLPVIYMGLARLSRFPKLATCIVFLLVPIIVRLFDYHHVDFIDEVQWGYGSAFPRAFDSFIYGMAFAVLFIHHRGNPLLNRLAGPIAVTGLLLLFVTFLLHGILRFCYGSSLRTPLFHETFHFLPSLASAGVLFLCIQPRNWVANVLNFKPLAFLGLVSYEWYLLHQPPVSVVHRYLGQANGDNLVYLGRIFLPSLGSLAAATAMYYVYSAPILAFTKVYLKKRQKL